MQGMLADVSIATGWATIGMMLAGRFVFQYLGWNVAATATPVVMLLAGGTFFGTSVMARLGSGSAAALATAGATAGAVTQALFTSFQFTLFAHFLHTFCARCYGAETTLECLLTAQNAFLPGSLSVHNRSVFWYIMSLKQTWWL